MKTVTIYTDGACSGNPGPGGWGAVLIYKNNKREISGYCEDTTNNRMELTACIEALKALKEKCNVELYTDSAYIFNAFDKGWIFNWQNNGWKKADKKPVENIDLWQKLLEETKNHIVSIKKVKGHSGDEFNEICDKLAVNEIKKNTNK